ncbi:MAG: GAF domain-containing protein [Anaerolineae bacterium]|nr:GAF domain-containing protein [Anaerolineae bacterium]
MSAAAETRAPSFSLHNLTRLDNRVGVGLVLFSLVVCVIAVVLYLQAALDWRSAPFLGVMYSRTLVIDGSTPLTDEGFPGLNAGMRRGDQIIGINGEALPITDVGVALERVNAIRATLDATQPLTLEFLRHLAPDVPLESGSETCVPVDGTSNARCTVTFTPGYLIDAEFFGFFVVPFLSGVAVLAIGIAVLFLRSNIASTRYVAVVCMLAGAFMIGLFDVNTSHQYVPLWLLAACMLGGSLIGMTLVFPMKFALTLRSPALRMLPPSITFVFALIFIEMYQNPPDAPSGNIMLQWATGIVVLGAVALTLGALRSRVLAPSTMVRDQSNTILIGISLTFIVIAIWLLNLLAPTPEGRALVPLNTSASMPFLIMPFLSLAYAALQYRTVDTDRILSGAITYVVMMFGVIIGFFLLMLSMAIISSGYISANNPVLLALSVFLTAVFFNPLRQRLQERIDAIYFRQRIDYQARVEAFAQKLTTLTDLRSIVTELQMQIETALLPAQIFIFQPDTQSNDFVSAATDVRFTPTSGLVERLLQGDPLITFLPGETWERDLVVERPRLRILKAMIIIGLRGADRLVGFLVIAPPRSRAAAYTYEEIRFLQNLTAQMTVAVERAQVVESLEQRVRELDVLSQVSQAVNFTVDYDNLLELISAQSERLLNLTHFYITLRDANTNELYHAFFLEDGERFNDKEERRWTFGNDLFSEVIRTGQPLAVANYSARLAANGGNFIYEDKNLRAWMAVPLVTGGRTLGVIAAGSTTPDRVFSDQQLKVFVDIASLAATSLDKARLFAETNVRARQLAALNDISRQLVAAEADLEELLKFITSSAADILNAEAGSLLLTVDDGTNDLEFRVAVGGGGQDIIGRRVPAKRGLVGEVASTGKMVLVNDARNDPRWGGEFAKGAFQTNSVVAVPLITQDRVIGVLELLNKRGAGSFSSDDSDLLTTFARQAAVAIENARLFELTDLQLTQRVGELETLERIDVELNRSLELITVAEITVRWALTNTKATAGLLGIVLPDPVRFQIVYKVGYEAEDLPEPVDGFYPVDKGILSRVLRTRQAELVPDVTIDPNYTKSLRGGLSQITIPMLSGGVVNAVLILETNREPRLRLADLPFLQRLADHASIAIANAQLYDELTRANASKSEFVSFVAHELKNPLTSIRGYSDVLLTGRGGSLNDMQRNFLATIRANAERMNTIVSDLNDVTKLQTNNMQITLSAISPRNVVTETLRPLQKQIEDKGQNLVVDVPDEIPLIRGDQNRLIQVLTNLVSNAHKYTPQQGDINVRTYVDRSLRDNKGRPLPAMVHFSVKDSGIGMSAEDLARLFTPYFRSDNPLAREQPGTGLGLTITRGLVQRHGGDIWVESTVGVGTTFHFTVPLAEEKEKAS